jgi:FMN phosphatase YigB (HAD superfamily)
MIVVKSELNIFFDVDGTLVIHDDHNEVPGIGKIKIVDPNDKSINYLKPHKNHVSFLKKCKGRGNHVTVWSGGGYRWAEAVVKALKLEEYVDVVMTKPSRYVDDLDAPEWLGPRIFLKE